jgi:hypothetical protein
VPVPAPSTTCPATTTAAAAPTSTITAAAESRASRPTEGQCAAVLVPVCIRWLATRAVLVVVATHDLDFTLFFF